MTLIPSRDQGTDGSAAPNRSKLIAGKDGSGDQQDISVDTSGYVNVNATLTPSGTQDVNMKQYGGSAVGATNAVHVQPGTGAVFHVDDNSSTLSVDDGAGSLTVDGTVTATLSASTNAGATAKTSDYDTGAGTDTVTMFGLALPASGGAVAGGTSTNPIQVSLANTAANSTAVKVDASSVAVPVTDNSGSLTVDAPVGTPVFVRLSDGAAAITNLATNIAQVNGSTVSTAATGVQKVGVVGNAGATVDAVIGAGSAPTNMVAVGGVYNSTEISPTTGQSAAVQLDAKGRQRMVLMDAAGNTRGANIDANNNLGVVLAAETTKVIGTTRTLGNAGAIIDGVNTAATAPANGVLGLGIYNSTEPSPTTGQSVGIQLDAKGRQRGVIMDAAGNTRGANVDASNRLSVTVDNVSATNISTNIAQVAGSSASTAATGVLKVGVVGNAGATVDSTVGAGTAPTNQVVVGSIFNSSAPAPTTGQAMAQQADQAGNLRTFPGIALTTLSNWTSATALNATQNIFTNSGASAVLVQTDTTSTVSGGAITFEGTYDGTNWVTIAANQVLDPTSTSLAQISLPYTLVASTNKPFLILTHGMQGLRIKLSTQITGSATLTPYYALLASNPAQETIAYSPTAANFNATVNVSQLAGTATAVNNGTASNGTLRVTVASDSTGNIATIGTSVTPGTAAANLGKAEDAAHTTGDTGVMTLGVRKATLADLSAGATDGDYEPYQVNRDGAMWVVGAAGPTGGWSIATGSIAATKTDIGTANTAGQVGGWYIYNPNASVAYVQFFNTQASGVTLGTTAPVYSLGIPATSAANVAPGMVGLAHSTAISIAVTTTRAGSTGPGSTVDYNIWYKQ